jgi:hypothetical protein
MRSAVGLIASLVVLFLGGGVIGVTLAELFAPGSWIASFVGLFALPLAFGVGLQLWYGFALLSLIPRLIGRLRGAPAVAVSTAKQATSATPAIPGGFVFLPVSSGAGFVAGAVTGVLSPTHSAWLVLLAYWAVGTTHGVLSWQLARRGYLVPPESI